MGNILKDWQIIPNRIMNSRPQGTMFVGPCHHGMARPLVVDGGTDSDMEGSYE